MGAHLCVEIPGDPLYADVVRFTDPRLCAAIVDRLTFGGNIIETGTDSYRLAHAKTHQADA
ncbi:hypothetical protein M2158_004557 [Streptomyces sp. SAI-144]|nr:hypothetical protein [Streptomyces sp. SAI-144]